MLDDHPCIYDWSKYNDGYRMTEKLIAKLQKERHKGEKVLKIMVTMFGLC